MIFVLDRISFEKWKTLCQKAHQRRKHRLTTTSPRQGLNSVHPFPEEGERIGRINFISKTKLEIPFKFQFGLDTGLSNVFHQFRIAEDRLSHLEIHPFNSLPPTHRASVERNSRANHLFGRDKKGDKVAGNSVL
ncbi:hypothetical protein TNIN_165811 [Trichonephila inaurata madagascariensis]|uniref:Uncharacterized protein n=1 Tax=Trichonephila inaurata madagascariensis TaxID=2747483 RepID=A0A8X6XXQ4_9ARAC|nr:hypothetical protein TNIN_165811 [Trichonephila inaurata madagascariensis]